VLFRSGLRAVAVMDTFAGIGVLAIALLVVVLAMNAIGWDLSGIPAERLTLVGSNTSPIPFHTLFTGMVFIQIFYWSTNQNITQKAMTAPTVREAQRGVLAAAAVRILIIPLIVVVPGVVAFKLFGPLGDAAYGRIVAHVLPSWLIGSFAALMAAAVTMSLCTMSDRSTAMLHARRRSVNGTHAADVPSPAALRAAADQSDTLRSFAFLKVP
jgi:SSS family solute:Na+ symporter